MQYYKHLFRKDMLVKIMETMHRKRLKIKVNALCDA